MLRLAGDAVVVPVEGRAVAWLSAVQGRRTARHVRSVVPPQGTTATGVVWDRVLSGDVEKLGVRWALGAYNLMDWRYDTVPSGEFRQRTIVQSGRSVLASVSASF